MDSQILEYFGLDSDDPDIKLAESQVNHDLSMLNQLITERENRFPSVDEFSAESGIDKATLEDFEHDPLDFTLEFVRLYALSVGAEIHHHVSTEEERLANDGWKKHLTLRYSRGNVTTFPSDAEHTTYSIDEWKKNGLLMNKPKTGRAAV